MIKLSRSVHIVSCIIGVWRAGAAFVICESSMPEERCNYIYHDCGCKTVIDKDAFEEACQMDIGNSLVDDRNIDLHTAAYAVYTSGTQGKPKGVLHEYGNIDEAWKSSQCGGKKFVSEEDTYGLISPMNFVAAVIISINATSNGGTLYLAPEGIVHNPIKLIEGYEEAGVTVTYLPPSVLRILKSFNSQLKRMILSSEAANNIYIEGIDLYNIHAMSESGFDTSAFYIDKIYDITPIGKPQWENRALIIDGEYCYENRYVRGYINQPELNKKCFIDGFFHTGDMAKELPSGDYVILGRKDDMVKIGGNRVEPSEIEKAARKTLGIKEVVVKAHNDIGHPYLVMYYTSDRDYTKEEVLDKLCETLPAYMIPAFFVRVEKFPLLPNGKLDTKALPHEFNELGGDSLLAMQIAVMDCDECSEDDDNITSVLAEKYSQYMCDYQIENEESTLFNLPVLYKMPIDTDANRLAKAFNSACDAHPMMRSIFIKESGEWKIEFKPELSNDVKIINTTEEELNTIKGSLVRAFVIGECMYRCTIFKTEKNVYLFMDIFHAAIDGIGGKILHRDIGRAYFGAKLEKDHYYICRKNLESIKKEDKYSLDKAYLEARFDSKDWSMIPAPDHKVAGRNHCSVIEFKVPNGVKYSNESSLEATLKAMAEYNNATDVAATWTYNARDTKEKKECVGLFIRDIPIGISEGDDVRAQIQDGLKHSTYQWSLEQDRQILYTTFQDRLHDYEGIEGIECESVGIHKDSEEYADNPMDIEFLDDSKGRRFTIRYDTGMYEERSVRKYGELILKHFAEA